MRKKILKAQLGVNAIPSFMNLDFGKAMEDYFSKQNRIQFNQNPNFEKQDIPNWAIQASNFVSSKFQPEHSTTTNNINASYDAISDELMSTGNPYGAAIGGAMKIGGAVTDVLQSSGFKTDEHTLTDQILGSKFLALGVPGIINTAGRKNTIKFNIDQDLAKETNSSYSDSWNFINKAHSKLGSYGLFSSRGRRKANKNAKKAIDFQNRISDISDSQNRQQLLSTNNLLGYHYNLNSWGGPKTQVIKLGAKIDYIKTKKLQSVIKASPIDFNFTFDSIEQFKDGGVIKKEEFTQKNVIPDGALHKNKHHIENTEGLTQKGIPVVDNEGNQTAEIEKNEIIFTLEVTKKLEELQSKYYSEDISNQEKDEIAIEAGKLLVEQILYNTDDRTSLIKQV